MRLLSITSMRNEGPFLLEWIAYHRLIGITDFLIFTNDCDDGTDLMLDALAQQGVVTHLRQQRPDKKSVQWQALNTAWKHPLRKAADWALFSDVDEFPHISIGSGRLTDLIQAAPDSDAIVLPWRLFGSSGIAEFRDQPVTQQFLRAAPYPLLHPVAGSFFKTLLRPSAFRAFGVHRPKNHRDRAEPRWRNADLLAMPSSFAAQDGRLSLISYFAERPVVELHHYSLRSVESFIVKMCRGLANRSVKTIDLGYFVERNFNSVDNTALKIWAAPLAAEIAALKALPGVAQLHEAACAAHRLCFEQAIRQIEAYTLYVHSRHAGDSRALPMAEAYQLMRRYQDTL